MGDTRAVILGRTALVESTNKLDGRKVQYGSVRYSSGSPRIPLTLDIPGHSFLVDITVIPLLSIGTRQSSSAGGEVHIEVSWDVRCGQSTLRSTHLVDSRLPLHDHLLSPSSLFSRTARLYFQAHSRISRQSLYLKHRGTSGRSSPRS